MGMYLKDMKPGMLVAYRKGYNSVCRARIESIDRSPGAWTQVEVSHGRSFEHRESLSSWTANCDLLAPWDEYKRDKQNKREENNRREALQEKLESIVARADLRCPVAVKNGSIVISGNLDDLEMLALDLEAAVGGSKDSQADALGEIFS